MATPPNPTTSSDELRVALSASRSSFLATAVFSLFINLLMLAPVIYMLEVYDRVLTSSSESTLLMLSLLLLFLFLVMGGLEWVRSQVLIITGNRLEHSMGARVFDGVFAQNLASGGSIATTQPLSDLLNLRQFLSGPALLTLFDAPWLPIYLVVMYMFHPLLGAVAVIAALILVALAVANERTTRDDLKQANKLNIEINQHVQRNLRNTQAIEAMGMLPRLRRRWQSQQAELLDLQARSSRRGSLFSTTSKTFRMAMQSAMLGLGALLAIEGGITPGTVIAGSLLLGRALSPIDQLINSWKAFLGAREAYGRLQQLLETAPATPEQMPLPALQGKVSFQNVYVTPAGAPAPILKGLNFSIEPGDVVAVIGPSAAGKSTLARAMLGLYVAGNGSIRLDGAEPPQWDREALGEYVGYLPQDVELLDGSVGENIARFGEVDAEKVLAAAQAAGVHEMILKLPEGYETRLTANLLSAGQRQRIGLARALYSDPRLVILDEPNSNLDTQGDAALGQAIQGLKRSGATVVVVTHRNNLLELVDKVMVLANGELVAYDQTAKVMQGLTAQRPQALSDKSETGASA